MKPGETSVETRLTVVVLGFPRVKTCGGDEVPTATLPKLAPDGVSVNGNVVTPVQKTLELTKMLPAVTEIVDDNGPGALGAQAAVIWQVRFAVSEFGQVVVALIQGGCEILSVGAVLLVLLENVSVCGGEV